MSDVTRILQSIEDGDPNAAEELLPLVYDELRKLAAAKMARRENAPSRPASREGFHSLLNILQICSDWG